MPASPLLKGRGKGGCSPNLDPSSDAGGLTPAPVDPTPTPADTSSSGSRAVKAIFALNLVTVAVVSSDRCERVIAVC